MEKIEKLTIERSIWIDAPQERVWQAVTEPEQLAKWFLPPSLGAQLKRDNNGTISVLMGNMAIEIAHFETLDQPRQVSSRSLPDGLLATTYALEEEKGGTRVTVTMSGFEALPEDARQERLAPSGAGWEKALANLKAYINGQELPYPQGYIAALFGYRREAKEKFAVERSIWIKATRERVWRAITDLEQVENWFSPGTKWQGTGLKVGGKFYVQNPETNAEMYVQVIDVVDPPHQFVTRTEPEPPEVPHVTVWTLIEEDGGTRLTITYTGHESEADDIRHSNMEQNAFGFGMMLENVKAHVERKSLPYPGGF
jgi:uncharacterized protein YndB with AHSA1/START domain